MSDLVPGLYYISNVAATGVSSSPVYVNASSVLTMESFSTYGSMWNFTQNQSGNWSIKNTHTGLFFGYDTSMAPSYTTPIQAVEYEVDWDVWSSSTTGSYQFFVHNTSLTPTMYGMGIGSAVYLSEATINNAYQTWIIEGIESLIGPIGGSDSLLSESTATTETITPSPSRTTSPIESIWSTA